MLFPWKQNKTKQNKTNKQKDQYLQPVSSDSSLISTALRVAAFVPFRICLFFFFEVTIPMLLYNLETILKSELVKFTFKVMNTSTICSIKWIRGVSFWRNCGGALVGSRNECLVYQPELINEGKLATVMRFECFRQSESPSWRRANARNVSARISLQWPIYSVDKPNIRFYAVLAALFGQHAI